jgi:hypothetical protein
MRNKVALASLVIALVIAPNAASAQQFFDFFGQAIVPANIGETLTMRSVVFDGSPTIETPLPLDFANFQYTIVLEGVVFDAISGSAQLYSGGTIALYEDDGSAADYADPSTFTDGTPLLTGVVVSLSRSQLLSLVSVVGTIDWTGGSQIDDFAPADRLDWGFFSGVNTAVADPGYTETWDGKVEPRDPVVSNENTTWGGIKSAW